MTELQRVSELAGFFAAHAIWSVSDGPPLVPFCAIESSDGTRSFTRFAAERLEAGVESARELYQRSSPGGARAALVYDAFVTFDWGKTDCVIVEAKSFLVSASLTMLVPYRNAQAGFAVYKPKLQGFSPQGASPSADVVEPFFRGVDAHGQAAAVWNAHLDQSR